MPGDSRKSEKEASGSLVRAHSRRLPTLPRPRARYTDAKSRRNVPEINKCWNLLQKQTLADFLFKRFLARQMTSSLESSVASGVPHTQFHFGSHDSHRAVIPFADS